VEAENILDEGTTDEQSAPTQPLPEIEESAPVAKAVASTAPVGQAPQSESSSVQTTQDINQPSSDMRAAALLNRKIALVFLVAILAFAAFNVASKPKRPEKVDRAVVAIKASLGVGMDLDQLSTKIQELATEIEVARIDGHDVSPYEVIRDIYTDAHLFASTFDSVDLRQLSSSFAVSDVE
jgi:hypothetical protein